MYHHFFTFSNHVVKWIPSRGHQVAVFGLICGTELGMGGLKTPKGQNYAKTRGEILIMHDTADSNITMDQFAGLARELESAGIAHEMITYGGAKHAFTVSDLNRYQEDADKKSWKRFPEFL